MYLFPVDGMMALHPRSPRPLFEFDYVARMAYRTQKTHALTLLLIYRQEEPRTPANSQVERFTGWGPEPRSFRPCGVRGPAGWPLGASGWPAWKLSSPPCYLLGVEGGCSTQAWWTVVTDSTCSSSPLTTGPGAGLRVPPSCWLVLPQPALPWAFSSHHRNRSPVCSGRGVCSALGCFQEPRTQGPSTRTKGAPASPPGPPTWEVPRVWELRAENSGRQPDIYEEYLLTT